MKDEVEMLDEMGFDVYSIADVLSLSVRYVSSILGRPAYIFE